MAQQGPRASASYCETQLSTRVPAIPAAPSGLDSMNTVFQTMQSTVIPGDGLRIAGMFAIVVSAYAPEGQTLTSGNLRCVVYNPYAARWTWAPSLDIDISDAAGKPAVTVVFNNVSRLGMLINWLTDTVVMSGGPYVQVRLDAFESTGNRGT